MNRRLLIPLTILVLVPLGLLAWLGGRLLQEEQEKVSQRYQELLLDRLQDWDAVLGGVMAEYRVALLRNAPGFDESTDDIRVRIEGSPYARSYFILDATGRMVYPPIESTLTSQEQGAIERTRAVWQSGAISSLASQQQSNVQQIAKASRPPEEGTWHTWFWDQGLHLMYWWVEPNGNIIAAEANRSRLLADLLVALPTQEVKRKEGAVSTTFRLVSTTGDTLHVFGEAGKYEGVKPDASIALSPPLGAWKLEAYSSRFSPVEMSATGLFTLLASFAGMFLVIGLAAYLYRENRRTLLDAAQRVSFVNQVSHELKTPLTAIRMHAELLADQETSEDDEIRPELKIIVEESERLSRLIANVLTFARSGRETLQIRPGAVDINEVVRETSERARPLLERVGLEIELDLNTSGTCRADREIVEQILGNLLGNAEKYARSGSRVDIKSYRESDQIYIRIVDDGPGILDKDRERVFDSFYRVSDRTTDGVAGTGIGLSIARELARLHGGDLILETSERGASFVCSLWAPLLEGESDS